MDEENHGIRSPSTALWRRTKRLCHTQGVSSKKSCWNQSVEGGFIPDSLRDCAVEQDRKGLPRMKSTSKTLHMKHENRTIKDKDL